MGLNASLYIAASGLSVNQKGIEVTGNNVANVNTEGYSKQTIELSSTPALEFSGQMIGQGTTVSAINRETNSFVTKQLTNLTSEYGEENAKSLPLAEIELIVGVDDSTISTTIDEFFDSWQELSSDPSSTLQREQVMQIGENLAEQFQSIVSDLNDVQEGINDNLSGTISTLNQKLQQIADLNLQIVSSESTGITANSLRDQRDLLLQNVSEVAGISYYEESNGMVSVQLASGIPLVTADAVSELATEWNSGSLDITLTSGASTKTLSESDFGGEVGGQLELRDSYIPELVEELDILAYNLATAINSVHTSGYDLDGTAGSDFFTFSSSGSTAWEGAASTLSMALTSSSQVAAGVSAAPDNLSGDNENVLAILELQSETLIDGTTTLNEYYASIAAQVGLTVSQNTTALETAEDSLTQMQNMRDSVSGVSVDEEMLLLTQYQSGYEAAARYLTAVDEMLDVLMSM